MGKDMLLHRASAFEFESLKTAFEHCVENFQYRTFPDEIKAKQIPEDDLPLIEDGRLVWKNFHDFFTAYIELFYPGEDGEKKLEEDTDLHGYWSSLEKASDRHVDGQEYRGYGLPALTKATLADQLTHTAFWVTGVHEVSGSIVEMFESPRNCATKIVQQGPKLGDQEKPQRQTMADVQTYFQDLCIISSTGYRLPALMSDWTHLLLTHDKSANDKCKQLHAKLLTDLEKTADQIWEKNRPEGTREVGFTKMMPDNFECSVCI